MLKLRFTDRRQDPIWIVDKSFTIGAADDNHLIIDHPTVDLQHARIVFANNLYVLHDSGSQEGTYINRQRVTQKALQDHDKILIGDVELEVLDPAHPENQPEWCLVACSSWLTGQEFPVRSRSHSNQVKIGRASHCDMIFAGTHLSREHVLLTVTDDCIRVRDLNSANGTFINDTRISEGTVYSGDQLRLDVYAFRVYGPGKPAARPVDDDAGDDGATKIRRAIPADVIPETQVPSSKQWKTRPTSPGNRSENSAEAGGVPATVKIVAVCLAVAVVALAAYLFFG